MATFMKSAWVNVRLLAGLLLLATCSPAAAMAVQGPRRSSEVLFPSSGKASISEPVAKRDVAMDTANDWIDYKNVGGKPPIRLDSIEGFLRDPTKAKISKSQLLSLRFTGDRDSHKKLSPLKLEEGSAHNDRGVLERPSSLSLTGRGHELESTADLEDSLSSYFKKFLQAIRNSKADVEQVDMDLHGKDSHRLLMAKEDNTLSDLPLPSPHPSDERVASAKRLKGHVEGSTQDSLSTTSEEGRGMEDLYLDLLEEAIANPEDSQLRTDLLTLVYVDELYNQERKLAIENHIIEPSDGDRVTTNWAGSRLRHKRTADGSMFGDKNGDVCMKQRELEELLHRIIVLRKENSSYKVLLRMANLSA